MINIGIVTTSRADFGIFKVLIDEIVKDKDCDYFLFAGGMHTTDTFGKTADLISSMGYTVHEQLAPLEKDDSSEGVAISMGETLKSYGKIWKKYKDQLDVVFVLGDRYEMFAATSSIVPFNIPIAHLHGGEVTLGAIDNKFRYAISSISDYHFVSSQEHSDNLTTFIPKNKVFNVGSLGVEAAQKNELLSQEEFEKRFDVKVDEGFILTTYHPETVNLDNENFIHEVIDAFKEIPTRVLCTLPNADTEGSIIREKLLEYEKNHPEKIVCFENLGQLGYYSAMKFCNMMVGNTSSGIIESTAFRKWVINIGDRQKGRQHATNVISVPNKKEAIIEAYREFSRKTMDNFVNPFGQGDTAQKIIEEIKREF